MMFRHRLFFCIHLNTRTKLNKINASNFSPRTVCVCVWMMPLLSVIEDWICWWCQETYKLSLPPRPHGNTCVVWGKLSKPRPRLKKRVKIHKKENPQVDPINSVQNSSQEVWVAIFVWRQLPSIKMCQSSYIIWVMKSTNYSYDVLLIVSSDTMSFVLRYWKNCLSSNTT